MTNEQDLPDDVPLELLTVCEDPTEAKMIEELLTNNGIDSVLQGDVNAIFPAGDLDDIRVFVKPEDVEKARELVDAYFATDERSECEPDRAKPSGDEEKPDESETDTV